MPRFYSKQKGRRKLAYRTPDWFRRHVKYSRVKAKGGIRIKFGKEDGKTIHD